MQISQARLEDLDAVMELHRKYHVDSVADVDKPNGFVTTNFTPAQLENLVVKENGITLARQDGKVISYAMAASWQFWAEWPFFAHMIGELPKNSFKGQPLTVDNSYQYGPICVDATVRGTGVFEAVFAASLQNMSQRFPIMVTFVNQINPRSYAAHKNKANMEAVGTFQFNNNNYYMLACHTKPVR